MSNHLSGGYKFPGGDARLDFTDLFAFVSPEDTSKTVLITDYDPFLTAPAFHPDATYRINVDNNGDSLTDIAFTFQFTEPRDGAQSATAHLARGREAQQPEPAGEVLAMEIPVGFDSSATPVVADGCRVFIGVRSDPFFADAEGALHGFNFTGDDFFAGKNVLTIALEVPNELLGASPMIGAWVEVRLRRDGQLVRMDRGGQPSLAALLNDDEDKAAKYCAHDPVDDPEMVIDDWSAFLEKSGGYPREEATRLLLNLLPDILRYDRSLPAGYPNGRILSDDVFDSRIALLTGGKLTSDGVGPHSDLLSEFPFLGLPNS
jgi:hypothetical protein